MKLQRLVETFNQEPSLELEVKIRLDFDDWCDAYTRCGVLNACIYRTIDVIHTSQVENVRLRTEKTWDDEKQKLLPQGKGTRKEFLLRLVHDKDKIHLARETPLAGGIGGEYRFKFRTSFVWQQWSIDFTMTFLTKNPTGLGSSFFGKGIEVVDFLDHARKCRGTFDDALDWELELEFTGKHITLEELENDLIAINTLIRPKGQEQYVEEIAKKLGKRYSSLKELLNKPVTLTFTKYQKEVLGAIDSYYLSDKADGERGLIALSEKRNILLTASKVEDLSEKLHKFYNSLTLLDCEVVGEILYIFDVLMYNGEATWKEPFTKREPILDLLVDPPVIQKKIQVRLTDYKVQIPEVYNREPRLYEVDGLIFTPAEKNYFEMIVYKWKPPQKNTVDFLIVRTPLVALGKPPHEEIPGKILYFLLCGMREDDRIRKGINYFDGYPEIVKELKLSPTRNYGPVQFVAPGNPLAYMWYTDTDVEVHGHVGEFRYTDKGWELLKMRPDKDAILTHGYYGNDYNIAAESFQLFQYPLLLEHLTQTSQTSYFQGERNETYLSLTKFNNFVKAQALRQLKGAYKVGDFACGKGADLFTHAGYGVENLILVDQDVAALEELNERIKELDNPSYYIYDHKPHRLPQITIKNVDLTQDAPALDAALDVSALDGLVINLAIHYFVYDKESLIKMQGMMNYVKPGGLFIFTTFSGERVFQLLKNIPYEGTYDIYENDVLKYSIKKLYKNDTLTLGQKIGVIHPFSNGAYVEEYLFSVNTFCEGFTIRQSESFVYFLDTYARFNPSWYERLSEQDKKYASLYQVVTLWKPHLKKKGI